MDGERARERQTDRQTDRGRQTTRGDWARAKRKVRDYIKKIRFYENESLQLGRTKNRGKGRK